MKNHRLGLCAAVGVAVFWLGCATGTDSFFDGTGGAGSGIGGAGGETSSSSTTSTSTTSTTTGTSTSTSTTSSTTTSSSTGAGGGPDCGAAQHLCAGICAQNTPQTGCFGSVSCAPCAAPPVNSTLTCTAQGTCDFTCNANYTKSGNTCVCAAQCCSDADCPGGTCSAGTCSGAGACDPVECVFQCFGMGCLGICVGDVCQCMC